MNFYEAGCEVLGGTVIGEDAPTEREFKLQIDAMTPVTVAVAKSMVNQGLAFTKKAIDNVNTMNKDKTLWQKLSTPDALHTTVESLNSPLGHLQWHKDNIDKAYAGKDVNATAYNEAADLKKWVWQAYALSIGTFAEKGLQAQIWRDFKEDVSESISAQLLAAANAVRGLVGGAFSGITDTLSAMKWVIYGTLGAVIVGGGIYLQRKLKRS